MKRPNPEAPDQRDVTQFPHVDNTVTDPAAQRYARGAQQRHPSRYSTPVAGGSTPPIPRLDSEAVKGLPMSDQANAQRVQAAPPPPPPGPGSLFQGSLPTAAGAPPLPTSPGLPRVPIFPDDILPEQAKSDPEFRHGNGSLYALSQPGLAYKYGIIRKGKHIAPQQLNTAHGLKPETLEGLQAIEAMRQQQANAPAPQAEPPPPPRAGASAAGRYGNAPEDNPADTKKDMAEALEKLDDLDFNSLRESMMRDLLNNDEQRKIIEARVEPLSITQLVMYGRVVQRVPIVPGQFEPEFQSMTGTEDLAIKRLIMTESKSIQVTDRYLLDKYSLMGVALGLRSINSSLMPDHCSQDGSFDDDKFWVKFNHVTRFPFHMLASLGVNYYWFDVRVRRLFVAEAIKNG